MIMFFFIGIITAFFEIYSPFYLRSIALKDAVWSYVLIISTSIQSIDAYFFSDYFFKSVRSGVNIICFRNVLLMALFSLSLSIFNEQLVVIISITICLMFTWLSRTPLTIILKDNIDKNSANKSSIFTLQIVVFQIGLVVAPLLFNQIFDEHAKDNLLSYQVITTLIVLVCLMIIIVLRLSKLYLNKKSIESNLQSTDIIEV